ncbi:MAG: SMC-Scp complex subunit ScpB [Patescibacteria group bacterium]
MAKNISCLESLLLVTAKPLSFRELANFLKVSENEIKDLVISLENKYNQADSGIHLAVNNKKVQFITNPSNAQILRDYFKDELSGELTNASLETLTIIAYRQPIAKEELEQIRGVNCSLILRNLLIRGLVEVQEEKADLSPKYAVTMDFIKHLGINSVTELPDYEKLNSDANLEKLLAVTEDLAEAKKD